MNKTGFIRSASLLRCVLASGLVACATDPDGAGPAVDSNELAGEQNALVDNSGDTGEPGSIGGNPAYRICLRGGGQLLWLEASGEHSDVLCTFDAAGIGAMTFADPRSNAEGVNKFLSPPASHQAKDASSYCQEQGGAVELWVARAHGAGEPAADGTAAASSVSICRFSDQGFFEVNTFFKGCAHEDNARLRAALAASS